MSWYFWPLPAAADGGVLWLIKLQTAALLAVHVLANAQYQLSLKATSTLSTLMHASHAELAQAFAHRKQSLKTNLV